LIFCVIIFVVNLTKTKMKTPFMKNMQAHPYIIFWIGLLSGALIIGLIFFFKAAEMREFESAVLRGLNSGNSSSQMVPAQIRKGLPSPTGNLNAFPTPPNGLPSPTGNLNAFPTPPNGLPSPTGNLNAFPTPPNGMTK
jgi:hypothetical protein